MERPIEYVAIDLETTGVDHQTDRITEIGMVLFDGTGPIKRFSSFVNPGIDIPYRIRLLTHIENDDVANAPAFDVIRDEVDAFLRDRPIVGQNVSFDVNFLDKAGIKPSAPVLDTFEFSSLLMPMLPNHSLRTLAGELGVAFPVQHRALPDAEAAMAVFLALRSRAAELEPTTLYELQRLAAVARWPLGIIFDDLVDGLAAVRVDPELRPSWLRAPARATTLSRHSDLISVKQREIDAAFAARTAGQEVLEERPEQVMMSKAVARTLSDGGSFVVEAGTGVGKSLGYLVPAGIFALRNEARVVVSTDTISLQEQLLQHDVPIARKLIEAAGVPGELRATHLKGRRNYLCLRRWTALRRAPSLTVEEARLLARLLIWLPQTQTGDRSELNLSNNEENAWWRISAAEENCLTSGCEFVGDGTCFLLRARQRAEESHVVIVNHSLLLSDVATEGHVIPSYHELVIDEAHNLEEEASRIFGFAANEADFGSMFDRIHARDSEGVLTLTGGIRLALRLSADAPSGIPPILDEVERAVTHARVDTTLFFEGLANFMRIQLGSSEKSNRVSENRLLLTRAMRSQPDWVQVEMSWGALSDRLAALGQRLEQLLGALQDAAPGKLENADELEGLATTALLAARTMVAGAGDILDRPRRGLIAWIDAARGLDKIGIASAPLEVDSTLSERLFAKKRATLLTGATLSTEGSCDYLRGRLGLADADELVLGSPFDYERSTLVMLPTDIPEPNQPNYQKSVEQTIIDLARASEGRALVLLTSNSAVRATRNGIRGALEQSGILVLGQGVDGSPRQLLRTLLENPRSVLLGSASFWEGVDITGDALSLLIMARLPFPVPTEPVYAARAELFDEPFGEYALPQAVLRFRQGFGRLIRRKTDRGVFVVLDRRIISREYGEAFRASLPRTQVVTEPASTLAPRVAAWLRKR